VTKWPISAGDAVEEGALDEEEDEEDDPIEEDEEEDDDEGLVEVDEMGRGMADEDVEEVAEEDGDKLKWTNHI
jgi:hypothetical protein